MMHARQQSCISTHSSSAAGVLLQRVGRCHRPGGSCRRLQALLTERELEIKLAIAQSTDRLVRQQLT